MFVPDIHSVPLLPTGGLFSDYSLVNDGEVQVGIWAAAPGTFGGSTGQCDEAMLMVEGRATVTHSGGTFDLVPGALWSTPPEFECEWTVHQAIRKMYVIDGRDGGSARPEYLSNAYSVTLGDPVPRSGVIAGDPHERKHEVSGHNRLEAGIWSCTPGSFPLSRIGYDEVFCVLAGHATITLDSGMVFDLRPGSMLNTPAGSTGRWDVHEELRKAYVLINGRG